MKIAIVGDTHITEYIREREDNYLNAVLLKLEYIATHNDKVIVLGDLFDRPTNSDYLFYRVYSLMKRYEGKFISILGNHDIIKHNYEQINKNVGVDAPLLNEIGKKLDENKILEYSPIKEVNGHSPMEVIIGILMI